MTMEKYLSKYLFDKYEYKEIVSASKCGLTISTSMKPESVAAMVVDTNITLNSLIIICNYIRDTFGMRAILPGAVYHLGT